jgi:uncharacterized protein (TIGR02246 family)
MLGAVLPLSMILLLAACATPPVAPADRNAEVAAVERAFARTMAERDHAAFARFIADEAVFVAGAKVLRGRAAIVTAWKRFYDGPAAPFSWAPDQVEVLDSGALAFSAGQVFDPGGKLVGRFTSIWRRESPGIWRIVFDTGSDACECAPAAAPAR